MLYLFAKKDIFLDLYLRKKSTSLTTSGMPSVYSSSLLGEIYNSIDLVLRFFKKLLDHLPSDDLRS